MIDCDYCTDKMTCSLMECCQGIQEHNITSQWCDERCGPNDLPRQLAMWVISLPLSGMLVMVLIYIMYIIMGCFLDGLAMMVLTLPVIYPVVMGLGFDSVWFGIILVILIEAGMLTPPVGLNLFVMQGIAPHYSFGDIVRGSLPYFALYCLLIVLLTAFPLIVLWLPSYMIGPG